MLREVLECCGKFYSTADVENRIDCFISDRFFKKFTIGKREIKKEILLVSYCVNCKHYVLKYLWYIKKQAGFFDYVESKVIRGKLADKIFEERQENLKFYPLPKNKLPKLDFLKQSKTVPWIYYKSLNGETQVPRYIDETGNAGRKIFSPVQTESEVQNV